MTKSLAKRPQAALELEKGFKELFEGLRDRAEKELPEAKKLAVPEVTLDKQNEDAIIASLVIKLAESDRGSLRAVQAVSAAVASRHQTWRYYPPTSDRPEGTGNLREFLWASGVPKKYAYDLAMFGDVIVPFADANGIPLGPYLDPKQWGKIESALYAIKRAIVNDSTGDEIKAMLDDMVIQKTRQAVRDKYNKKETDSNGDVIELPKAALLSLGDGSGVIAIRIPDLDDRSVMNRLNGSVKWTLVAGAVKKNLAITIAIDIT